jgi:U3 small nucleolar ribonucleoprotein component
MANEIVAAVHSARLLMDMVKANETLANVHELVAAVAEVNAKLLSAQTAALLSQETQAMLHEEKAALTERIRELEKEVAALKEWKRETERY